MIDARQLTTAAFTPHRRTQQQPCVQTVDGATYFAFLATHSNPRKIFHLHLNMPDTPPSTANVATACAIIGLVTGYLVGQAKSLGLFGGSPIAPPEKRVKVEESSDEDEDADDSAPSEFPGHTEECKLVLVVRTDLGMTKGALSCSHSIFKYATNAFTIGKIGAQCGHATLACYKQFLRRSPNSTILKRWERSGQMKVALQVKSEEELEVLQAQALSLGMVAQIIHDAGRTQIASGSATVLGIGPAPKGAIDQVTGNLKLL